MIQKATRRFEPRYAAWLVSLLLFGMSGCSMGGSSTSMVPLPGEPPDDPDIAAIKNSGKPMREIRELVLAKMREKQAAANPNPKAVKKKKK